MYAIIRILYILLCRDDDNLSKVDKMSTYEIDLEKVMDECCDSCDACEVRHYGYGEPSDVVCAAGEPGCGTLEFDMDNAIFYCVEGRGSESAKEDAAVARYEAKRGL